MVLKTSLTPWLLAIALIAGACAPAARGLPPAPAPPPFAWEPEELGDAPEVVEAEVRSAPAGLLGEAAYDLPVEANTWVEAELNYLVGQRATVIGRWLERGDFYEPFIKGVLAEYGLPTDLFHLAMIESGFVPSARSRAGAVGLWQFMPATARAEGLRVDGLVDERMDPVRSTDAAARHLRGLHRRFNGDWPLAAAAYNAGVGRVTRGMQGFGADNFWDLAVWGDLAEETKHYVPRLYAVTIIGRDRPRFGFGSRNEQRESFAFDTVRVDLATPLAELAEIGGVSADDLARLNPHLLQRTTPPGDYFVWVPAGMGAGVQHAFLNSGFRRDGGMTNYVVRRGDSLNRIAARSGVPAARIRELNPQTRWDRLPIGHRLRLPAAGARALAARAAEPAAAEATAPAAVRPGGSGARTAPRAASTPVAAGTGPSHTVRAGETLWSIARAHGVEVGEIQAANEMRGGTTIVAGRTLRLPASAAAPAAAPSAGAGAAPSTEHVVRSGDTLWSIAREYGSTVDSIQAANRIEHSRIVPGQKLVVPR